MTRKNFLPALILALGAVLAIGFIVGDLHAQPEEDAADFVREGQREACEVRGTPATLAFWANRRWESRVLKLRVADLQGRSLAGVQVKISRYDAAPEIEMTATAQNAAAEALHLSRRKPERQETATVDAEGLLVLEELAPGYYRFEVISADAQDEGSLPEVVCYRFDLPKKRTEAPLLIPAAWALNDAG